MVRILGQSLVAQFRESEPLLHYTEGVLHFRSYPRLRDEGRIHNRATCNRRISFPRIGVESMGTRSSRIMPLHPVAELAPLCSVGGKFAAQIDADRGAQRPDPTG